MPNSPAGARRARIADQIQRELAELVRTGVRDPRVRFVTLTGVELSRDQSHAKVYFTVLGTDSDRSEAGEGLAHAAGYLRSSLAHRLSTRTVPQLAFAFDESVERGVRLTRLIDEAVKAPAGAAAPKRRARRRASE